MRLVQPLFWLLLGLLTGCAELQLQQPNPSIEPPEIRGDRGLILEANASGAHQYRSTGDAAIRPPDLSRPELARRTQLAPGLSYSPFNRWAFGGELNALGQGGAFLIKFQPLGSGTRAAEDGDIPIGLYVRAGYSGGKKSGTQSRLFGPGDEHWSGKVQSRYLHAGVSTGVRVHPHILLYGGGAVGTYRVDTEVTQEKADTDPGGVYTARDNGTGMTGGVGVLFNWKVVQFYVGGDYTHLRYDDAGAQDQVHVRTGLYITPK